MKHGISVFLMLEKIGLTQKNIEMLFYLHWMEEQTS